MLEQVVPLLSRDLKVTLGREAAVWVATDLAAFITIRIATAVAIRLGASSAILTTGAASGAATLGVGLILGFIIDGMADWIMKQAGYDPTGKIIAEANEALTRIQVMIIDGDTNAINAYRKLRHLQVEDPFGLVRSECRKAADRIETGGSLGLRLQFERMYEVRSKLREAALRKLILEGASQ